MAALLGLFACGCGVPADTSAPYFPSVAAPTRNADAVTEPLPAHGQGVATTGTVSRPNPSLTPGAAALSDFNAVCGGPKVAAPRVARTDQDSVFAAYNIPVGPARTEYGLDYLVPVEIGGSTATRNLWPAAFHGIGYHEKQQLNARIRVLVCGGQMDLATAQRQIASDWYALLVRISA